MPLKAIEYVYKSKFQRWRSRRYSWFRDIVQPKASDYLIDIGGEPQFWLPYPPLVAQIDCLNLERHEWPGSDSHNIQTLIGDGCNLPFSDQSYAIAFLTALSST